MHHVVGPLAGIISSILPCKFAPALKFVHFELTFVAVVVWPVELAKFLHSEVKNAYKISAIGPELFTVTMLLVIDPISLISNAIIVMVFPLPMRFIIFPMTIVVVFVSVEQEPRAVEAILCELTIEISTIQENSLTERT